MAKVSEVINEVITRFVVDDQTAQPTEAAGARIDALQDKSDALAESGKRIGEAFQEGLEAAGSAANNTVEAVISGTGKLETSAGRLKDSVDQITHDVQLGAENTEKALSGIGEAAEDTVTSADKIGTSFKDSLSDATKSAEDLVTVITRSATSADKTWQNSAARTGDSISKIQRQIRLAQDEYDRLDARGVEAIGSGSTSPEDVTRVLDAQREKIDALVQQEAKLRLEQTATAETFTKMGEDGSSASAVLEKLSAAEMAEVMSLRELRSAFENNLLSLNGYRKGVQDITADYAAMQRASDGALSSIASSYQSNLNSNLGISLPSNDLSASRLEDITGAFADADAIRAKIVPLAAAERDYAKAVAEADSALATDIIKQKEYDAYVGKATDSLNRQKAAFGGSAAAVKLTSFEMGILADETHKFFDQVMAGGSPLQAAFYQVPNMVQVMGGLDGALTRVIGVLTGPAGLAAGAVAAGAAIFGMGKYAESEQESLAQLSTHLRATRADYDDMSKSAENAARALHDQYGDISLSDSRSTVQTIAAVPTVDASQIQRLTADSRDLAAVMGTTVPEAAKTLAAALEDPAKEAQALSDQHLPGFNAGLVLSVQHMVQMGQQADAVSLVIQKLESAIHGAADQGLTPFQTAWRKLSDEMGGASSIIAAESRSIGDLFVSMATEGINAADDLVKHLKKLPDELSSIWSSIKSGSSSGFSWLEGKIESLMPANVQKLMAQGNTPDPTFSMPTNTAANHRLVHDGGISAVQSMINQVAQEQHLNGDITSLMHAIAPAESSTGQYLKGQLVRSSAGAIGAMQVKQDNAAGNDLTDLHGNVSASAQLLEHLYTKYDGDQTLVAMAYNWGESNLDRYLKSDGDPSRIPAETMDYLAKTTEGVPYGAVTSANMQKSVDSVVSQGDTGVNGQRDDLTRSLVKQEGALDTVNKQYQAGIISQKEWSDQTKVIHDQIDATSASLANLRDPLQEVDHSQTLAAQSASALTGYDRQMVSVAQEVDQAQLSLNGTHASAAQIMGAQAREQSILADQWNASVTSISRQADEQDAVNTAYAQTSTSLDHVTNYQKAYEEALQSFDPHSTSFTQHVNEMTAALDKQTATQKEQALIGQTWQNKDQISLLQAETASLGQNDDARQKMLTHMQTEQELVRNGDSLTDTSTQTYLKSVDALSDATAEYQHAQQTLDDFTGSLSDMTDQLSDGVVQGFLQGTSSGMSFKSTMQGIEAQIVSMIAKMALINPLLNSIDGGTRTTLSDFNNMFSKMGSASGSGSALQDDNLNAISQSGWAMSPEEVQQEKKQLNQSSSFSLSSLFSGGIGNGGTESLGGALNMGMGMLGGFAAGSSLSKLLTDKLFDGSKSSEVGGEVGSGVGSIVGGIFGGPLGSLVGGSVIGAIGDAIGSLFAKRSKDYQYVSVDNGQLAISGHVYKDIHGNDTVASGLQTDLDSINNAFDYTGVSATNTDTLGKVGYSKKGKKKDTYSLTDLLPDLDLTSSSANMNLELKQLMPSSFDSVDTFTQDLESLKSLADELDSMKVSVSKFDDSSHVTVDHFTGYTGDMAKALSTLDGKTLSVDDLQSQFQAIEEFVGTTMPGLLDVTASGSESLMQQVDDLKAKYQDAANTAASYGLDAQALLDKGNAIAAAMIANEQTTLSQSDQSVQARYLSATGDQEGADLLNQQVSAAQEIQQLQDNWRSFLGDNFADNVTYQQQLADLEKTQNAERLQIQQEYQEKALEQQEEYQSEANEKLESVFDSLDTYEKGLTTSDASPLSVADQYKAANDNLHTDYQAALGGNYDALSALQTDMQNFLSLSQKFNGGGAAYVSDFNMVQTIVKALGGMDLTKVQADVLNKIQQGQSNQTETLASLLQDLLKTSVAQLQETRFQAEKSSAA
ncbi:phage tail protein [Acetobacter pomorum]|uniref:phage tail length tape measure family protein n=1 Tax=Acetobacter TaxID=434 RepID=UPI000DE96DBF|nr:MULTISPECIES: phage tail length tape measure family protein [Acetobacter]AXC25918.1 phage tail protein [Acetobacter sp. JWB]KAA8426528.1 phage tail protein [Acetobacter pomorum]KAA8436001.1 phage tail protein [Acetobacter pomorum]KAA8454077.1 phage tail protein [Acetobacter pomorum]